jgi:hypothetical protein
MSWHCQKHKHHLFCSRAGGYFFLGCIPNNGDPIKLKGAIHVTFTILKLVAASSMERQYFWLLDGETQQ